MEVKVERKVGWGRWVRVLLLLGVVCLGWYVWEAYGDKRVMEAIEKEGMARVYGVKRWPDWVHAGLEWVGIEGPVVGKDAWVSFDGGVGAGRDERLLALMGKLKGVESIMLVKGVVPEGIEVMVAEMEGLRELEIRYERLSDRSLENLVKVNAVKRLVLHCVEGYSTDRARRLLKGIDMDEFTWREAICEPLGPIDEIERMRLEGKRLEREFSGVDIIVVYDQGED